MELVRTIDVIGSLTEFEEKHAPNDLYLEGDQSLLTSAAKVSVVGSRNATPEGIKRAQYFTKALVRAGITVVSGLAKGIDTVAHETAISSGGKTITVLGTGLDRAYPPENKELLETIKRDHLAVSQFRPGTEPKPTNFPQRNRTMALISDATVIVEASEKSGTKHQGWEALRLGRLVFLMENVASDEGLSWPKEMIGYGAQTLTRDNLEDSLSEIPRFLVGEELAF